MAELFRQLVVNLAIGNTDAHAKNYSLLYRDNALPELSPLYDVVPVMDIEPKAHFLSMRIGGEIQAEKVQRHHLIEEAASWGMTAAQAEALFDDTLANLEAGAKKASEFYPNASERHEPGLKERITRLM